MSTKPTPGPRAPGPHARSASRWARLAALPALLAAALLPATAGADTSGKLPQGYTNDSLPQLPANSDAPAAQPASDVTAGAEADAYVDTDPTALDDFREPLAPYGAWVEDPTYGTVWVPSSIVVGADFAPYQTAGHWETTVDGDWLWVSDYAWGYVPFHYGRWVWIAGTGWGWIPGRLYAPAWVAWRVGDAGYIGWAPLPPAYYWSGGVAVSLWVVPPAAYVFCPTAYVFHHHVHTYVVHDHTKVNQIARGTRPYKPASPNGGPGGGGSKYKPAHPSPAGSGKEAAAGAGRGRSGPPSPSFEEAKIPQNARPKARAAGDATALRYARPSTTPRSVGSRASRGSFTATPGATGSGRDIPAVGRAPGTAPPQVGASGGGRGLSPAPAAPPPKATSKPARRAPSNSNDNDSARTQSASPSPSAGGSRSAPGFGTPAPAAKPAARPAARPSAPARGGRGRR